MNAVIVLEFAFGRQFADRHRLSLVTFEGRESDPVRRISSGTGDRIVNVPVNCVTACCNKFLYFSFANRHTGST